MQGKIFLSAVLTAFLVGAGAVVVAHAEDSGTEVPDDPGKQAALESTPVPTDVSQDVITDKATTAPATTNLSNSFQLNILDQQQAIQDMMTGSVAPGRLPATVKDADQDTQLAAALSDDAIAARKKTIAYNYTAGQVDQQLSTYNEGLRSAITNPQEAWLYIDNTFTVTEWQGIRWSNNNGSALLKGHQSYQEPDGDWVSDADEQWKLSFSHADKEGHYHLSSYSAVPLNGDQG